MVLAKTQGSPVTKIDELQPWKCQIMIDAPNYKVGKTA